MQGLHAIETASIDELRALQLERMSVTMHHAYTHSPVYKQLFDRHNVHPSDLRSLDDLAKFPLTTKEYLRQHYPFDLFCVPRDKITRIHASSGTTGKPTVVGYTREDIDDWADVVARSIYATGGRSTDMVHIAYGYGLFTGGLGAHYGAERLGCAVIPMSGGQTAKQVQLIVDFNPDLIMVTPSYMLNIADEMERRNIDGQSLNLRCGIFGAEPWTEAMRVELESRLGIDALDIYGLSEVIGPGVAQECLDNKGKLTIWEDYFYPEIIDPNTLEVVQDGQLGELVFTSLTKRAMPIIRYRSRDLTRLLPSSGRVMRCMEKILGRSDDMLIIRGVNVFPSQIEEQILNIIELSPHYLIEVSRQNNLDQLTLLVESKKTICNTAQLEQQLTSKIKTYIGISVRINILQPNELPRSDGKARRVIDKRQLKC